MKIRPLYDRVVIRRMEEETMTKGGILLPDSATEKPSRGEVIAVGPGKSDKGVLSPLTVKVGDKVLFGKYAGTEVNVENEDVIVMREDDIMGIIE
jgi:chaperonin GroES